MLSEKASTEERIALGTMVKLTEAEGGRKTLAFTVVRPAEGY